MTFSHKLCYSLRHVQPNRVKDDITAIEEKLQAHALDTYDKFWKGNRVLDFLCVNQEKGRFADEQMNR